MRKFVVSFRFFFFFSFFFRAGHFILTDCTSTYITITFKILLMHLEHCQNFNSRDVRRTIHNHHRDENQHDVHDDDRAVRPERILWHDTEYVFRPN